MYKIIYTVLILIVLCNFSKAQKKGKEDLPNIVYVLVDDMGQGDLSCYNSGSKIQTPNIDDLAQNGAMFTDAHSASAVCTPTRYGIITGRYSWRTTLKERVVTGYDPCIIPQERETVPKLMKRNGYATALIGKWHLGLDWACKEGENIAGFRNDITEAENKIDFTKAIKHGPVNLGFDYFYGTAASWDFPPYIFIENNRLSEQPIERKGGWIGELPDGINESELQKKEVKNKLSLATWRNGYCASLKPNAAVKIITEHSIKFIENQNAEAPFFLLVSYTAPHTPVVPRKEFLGKSDCGIYGDFCIELDDAIGKLYQSLEKKGLAENTLFVFTADNGSSLKAIPMALQKKYNHSPSYIYKGYKARLDEGGHRVPFIATWPGKINPNGVNSTLTCLNDLYATCAEIVGENVDSNVAEDSFSILPQLLGEDPDNSNRVVINNDFQGYFAIRKGKWKLSYPKPGKSISLFNLDEDPAEENNLVDKMTDKVDELTKLLTESVTNGRTTPGPVQKNDGPEKWEQLYWMNK